MPQAHLKHSERGGGSPACAAYCSGKQLSSTSVVWKASRQRGRTLLSENSQPALELQTGISTLPSFQGAFGGQVKHGTTLEALLRSYFAGHIINDAACTWCSLKWTVLEHSRAPAAQPLRARPVHIHEQSAACRLQSREQDATDSTTPAELQQTALAPDSMHAPGIHELQATQQEAQAAFTSTSMLDMGVHAAQKIHQEPEAAAEPAGAHSRGLLEQCVEGSAPLPEVDVESLASQAGLPWVERRGPLLTRMLIAQAPEVLGSQPFPAL